MAGPVLTASGFAFICNREAATLYDKFGNQQGGTITDAKRLPQGNSERAPSYGEYIQTEVDWRLPAAQVSGSIQSGWSIHDSNSIPYVVIDVDPPSTYSAAWRCSCRMVNVLGLINTVDWRKVNQDTDDFADRITDPTTFSLGAASIPARIQPASAEILDILGKRGLMNHYAIYVLPNWDLSFGDLIIDTQNSNQMYKVVGWKTKKELAEALTILAEIQP